MTTHDLKTHPEFYEALLRGDKTFELRRDDRGFAVGDRLRLHEWDPVTKRYVGRVAVRRVTYILRGTEHLAPGFVAMAIVYAPLTDEDIAAINEIRAAQGDLRELV